MSDPLWSVSPFPQSASGSVVAAENFGGAPGGISGSLLRPGAIDQQAFKLELAKAQAKAQAKTVIVPAPGPAIPELSPAQFRSLVGETAPPSDGSQPPSPLPASTPQIAPAPTDPQADASATDPGQPAGADDVILLHRFPDKDEREMLRGKSWRVVEDPRSRPLFFGADGEFGFDDFIDLINPLQHIPLVNVAYRSLTGDQIAGAPQLMGSIVFGPLSVMSTIADLAVKSSTGQGMAENALAALFGGRIEGAGAPEQTAMAAQSELDRGTRRS
jgi:hypothetical protein